MRRSSMTFLKDNSFLLGFIIVLNFTPLDAWSSEPLSQVKAAPILKVAVPNPILKLDPDVKLNAQEIFILPLIYEHLFLGNGNGDITPELAESWSFDPATHRLLIRIRKGRRFSDGSEVRAEDVAASFVRFCDPHNITYGRLIGLKG